MDTAVLVKYAQISMNAKAVIIFVIRMLIASISQELMGEVLKFVRLNYQPTRDNFKSQKVVYVKMDIKVMDMSVLISMNVI